MSTFGDHEPEDSWHPDDPVPLLIDNLLRRLSLLEGLPELRSRTAAIETLQAGVARYRQRALPERDKVRLDQIAEDLDFLIHQRGV